MQNLRKNIQKELSKLGQEFKTTRISDLCDMSDSKDKVIQHDILTFDYSKQRLDQKTLDFLLQIPDLVNLKESFNLLFSGIISLKIEQSPILYIGIKTKKINLNSFFPKERKLNPF